MDRSPPSMPRRPWFRTGMAGARRSAARPVQVLEQVVSRELDHLVAPFCGAIHAGDEAGAVDASEVADDEGVAGLRLVRRTIGQPEVPARVLVPRVTLEGGVLVGCR